MEDWVRSSVVAVARSARRTFRYAPDFVRGSDEEVTVDRWKIAVAAMPFLITVTSTAMLLAADPVVRKKFKSTITRQTKVNLRVKLQHASGNRDFDLEMVIHGVGTGRIAPRIRALGLDYHEETTWFYKLYRILLGEPIGMMWGFLDTEFRRSIDITEWEWKDLKRVFCNLYDRFELLTYFRIANFLRKDMNPWIYLRDAILRYAIQVISPDTKVLRIDQEEHPYKVRWMCPDMWKIEVDRAVYRDPEGQVTMTTDREIVDYLSECRRKDFAGALETVRITIVKYFETFLDIVQHVEDLWKGPYQGTSYAHNRLGFGLQIREPDPQLELDRASFEQVRRDHLDELERDNAGDPNYYVDDNKEDDIVQPAHGYNTVSRSLAGGMIGQRSAFAAPEMGSGISIGNRMPQMDQDLLAGAVAPGVVQGPSDMKSRLGQLGQSVFNRFAGWAEYESKYDQSKGMTTVADTAGVDPQVNADSAKKDNLNNEDSDSLGSNSLDSIYTDDSDSATNVGRSFSGRGRLFANTAVFQPSRSNLDTTKLFYELNAPWGNGIWSQNRQNNNNNADLTEIYGGVSNSVSRKKYLLPWADQQKTIEFGGDVSLPKHTFTNKDVKMLAVVQECREKLYDLITNMLLQNRDHSQKHVFSLIEDVAFNPSLTCGIKASLSELMEVYALLMERHVEAHRSPLLSYMLLTIYVKKYAVDELACQHDAKFKENLVDTIDDYGFLEKIRENSPEEVSQLSNELFIKIAHVRTDRFVKKQLTEGRKHSKILSIVNPITHEAALANRWVLHEYGSWQQRYDESIKKNLHIPEITQQYVPSVWDPLATQYYSGRINRLNRFYRHLERGYDGLIEIIADLIGYKTGNGCREQDLWSEIDLGDPDANAGNFWTTAHSDTEQRTGIDSQQIDLRSHALAQISDSLFKLRGSVRETTYKVLLAYLQQVGRLLDQKANIDESSALMQRKWMQLMYTDLIKNQGNIQQIKYYSDTGLRVYSEVEEVTLVSSRHVSSRDDLVRYINGQVSEQELVNNLRCIVRSNDTIQPNPLRAERNNNSNNDDDQDDAVLDELA